MIHRYINVLNLWYIIQRNDGSVHTHTYEHRFEVHDLLARRVRQNGGLERGGIRYVLSREKALKSKEMRGLHGVCPLLICIFLSPAAIDESKFLRQITGAHEPPPLIILGAYNRL